MQRNCVVDTYIKLPSFICIYIIESTFYFHPTVLKYLYYISTTFRCSPFLACNIMLEMDAERKDAYHLVFFAQET